MFKFASNSWNLSIENIELILNNQNGQLKSQNKKGKMHWGEEKQLEYIKIGWLKYQGMKCEWPTELIE